MQSNLRPTGNRGNAGAGVGRGMPQQLNVDLDDLPFESCDDPECDSQLFDQARKMKWVPAVVSSNGQDQVVVLPVFVCRKCGKEKVFNR